MDVSQAMRRVWRAWPRRLFLVRWTRVLLAVSFLVLFGTMAKATYGDFAGAQALVSFDEARCLSIARSFPAHRPADIAKPCLARAEAKAKIYRGLVFAHLVLMFVVLIAGPGLTTIVVTNFWRRVRPSSSSEMK
jgi:hypothetical protein